MSALSTGPYKDSSVRKKTFCLFCMPPTSPFIFIFIFRMVDIKGVGNLYKKLCSSLIAQAPVGISI